MEARERILEAAQELFFRFGIKSVTMDDIAKHLAISKKTIYQYFEDKDQIVVTLTREDLLNHQKQFKSVQEEASNPIEEIMEMMKHVATIFSQMNPNVFYDMQKYHPQAWQKFREFKENCILQLVEENLKRGIKEGLYRSDFNPRIIAKVRIEQIEMGINPAVFPPDKFNISEVQVCLMDHFLHGIATLKGHKLINKYKQLNEDE